MGKKGKAVLKAAIIAVAILFVIICGALLATFFIFGKSQDGIEHTHEFGKYIYNNDATCTKLGTCTAKCLICGENDVWVV